MEVSRPEFERVSLPPVRETLATSLYWNQAKIMPMMAVMKMKASAPSADMMDEAMFVGFSSLARERR